MRRIRDNKENETVDNVHRAYANFSKQKHNRQNIRDYEVSLSEKLDMILEQLEKLGAEVSGLKTEVVKTNLTIEHEMKPAINLLAEGQNALLAKLAPRSEVG